MAGALSVSIITLPLITTTTEDAIKDSLRDILKRVWDLVQHAGRQYSTILPACLPRIMTGVILAAGRGFGEAAVLLYTTGSGTNIRWGNWNLASSTCPLNPFRSAETLSLQIWDLQVNGQNQDLANLASAVLLILVLAFSIGANVLSNKINKKNSGEKA